MGTITVQALGGIAIAIIVAVLSLSFGGEIFEGLWETTCDGTWGTYANSTAVHPTLGSYGPACCTTVNASDSEDCTTWEADYSYNATYEGLESMETFGEWIPTLALVVMAAVIIGVLVFYLGRSGRS